jgi:hypothetical protein
MRNRLETRTGWEERVMLGTAILVWPRLAAPIFWCTIEACWGYVLPHLRAFQVILEHSSVCALWFN